MYSNITSILPSWYFEMLVIVISVIMHLGDSYFFMRREVRPVKGGRLPR
ncbi:MAG: hypothetical protein ACRD8K_02550 [Nitrososphaeraceae archaeon]